MSNRARRTGLTTRQRSFQVPLTIGVIADTHIYTGGARSLHQAVPDVFRRAGVGVLVHLGDSNTRSVLEDLAEIAPLIAVPGNNDDPELHFMLPPSLQFTVGPFRFGAIHGHGGRSAVETARAKFGERVDCVLFGHSHKPLITREDSTIYFNPGSATDRRWFDHFGVGIIRVTEQEIEPELVLYGHPDHLRNISFDRLQERPNHVIP